MSSKPEASSGKGKRRRARRILRALVALALLTSAALASAWLWIESPSGQERVRRWLEARGTSLLRRTVRIDALELDLLPLNATLTGIEIEGAAGNDQPLFRAAAAHVRVHTWALLSRELRVGALDIDAPVVHWDIAEGSGPALDAAGGGRLTLVIDNLGVVDGAVEINHDRWNLDTRLTDVNLALQPVDGASTSDRRRSGLLRVQGGRLRIEPGAAGPAATEPGATEPTAAVRGATATGEPAARALDFAGAEVSFTVDEDLLSIDDARFALGNSELTAGGRVNEWRRGELAVGGLLDVRDVVALGGFAAGDTAAGDITVDATITFGDDPPRFAGTLSSPSLTVAGIETTAVSAEVSASAEEIVLDALVASLFEGSITASVHADPTARPLAWRLEYGATDIDLAALTATDSLPGIRFAGVGSGNGALRWRSPLRETISGEGSFDLELPSDTLARIPRSAPAMTVGAESGADSATAQTDVNSGTASPQLASPSLPLPVEAHAEYTLDAGTLVLQNTVASLPRTRAELEGRLEPDGSIAGSVNVQSDDLRMLDRFFNQIRRFRGEQPVPQPLGIAGRGVVGADFAGSLAAPTLDGTLEARSLSVGGTPVGDIDGSLRLAGEALEIFDLTLTRDGGRAEGEGRFRIGPRVTEGPDYSVGLRLERFPMEADLPRLGTPLSVAGETSGELTLEGSYGLSPAGEVALRGDSMRLNDLGDLRVDVQLRLSPEEWVAERFELSGPPGRLTASGSWLRADDTLQARVNGTDIDASVLSELGNPELSAAGTVQLEAQLTGPFSEPDAAATVRWNNAAAYGVTLGSVASSAELRGRSLAIAAIGRSDPTDPAVPPPTPRAQGGSIAVPLPALPSAGWVATLSADLQAPSAATLRAAGESNLVLALLAAQGYDPGDDLQVTGAMEVSGSGELGEWTRWSGSAVLDGFALSTPELRFAVPEPLTLDLRDQVLRIDLPRLESEAGSLEARAAIDVVENRWLEATAAGSLSLEVLEVFADELQAGGSVEVNLEAEGNILAGDVGGDFVLHDVAFAHPAAPWSAEGVSGIVRLSGNRLELVDVRGMSGDRPFEVSGDLPLAALAGDETSDPVSLDLTIDALPLRPLWQRTGRLQELITGGQASVTVSVAGRGTNWRTYDGHVDVRELRVNLTDLPLTMPEPTSIVVRDGGLRLEDAIVLQGPGTDLRVGGAFMLAPFRLDAHLQGSANLDPLNAVTGSWGIAGRAEIDVDVAGDPPDLTYDGTINVTSGLVNAPILQPIENISASLTLQNRLLRIEDFTGTLGGSGAPGDTNVAADGEIQLAESVPQRFTLNLRVDEALLRIDRGIRVTASADLVHEGTFERSLLSGTLDVSDGEYTRRWEDEADLASLAGSNVAGVDHPLARSVVLDLEVRAPGDVRIANNMADVELNADLRIRGTLAEPVLLGTTTVLDGSVMLNDQRYRFLRGSIEFQNPLRTEPNLDIAVETSIRQYLVTINVSGSPVRGDINATFVSSPPLSDLQLIQLLTVGEAPEEGLRNEADSLGAVGAQATSFLTRQYLNQVERGAQRVFGIDRFRVEPSVVSGSGDPTARVTIGKQVTPDLWVSWTTVLGTTDEQIVTVEYQLTRGIRVTASREDDGSLGIDVRFDHRLR